MKSFAAFLIISLCLHCGLSLADSKGVHSIPKDEKIKKFHHHMHKNIDKVLRDNPEIYETGRPSRGPASLEPEVEPKVGRDYLPSGDSTPQGHGIGLPKW